jgi:predicted nucleic acid-binding protein
MAVIDASVWISFFLESDIHHPRARELIHSLFQNENETVRIPNLALVEIAGTLSRVTRSSILANKSIRILEALAVEVHELDEPLSKLATELASQLTIKGADAVYVALARDLADTLVTFDKQQCERAAKIVDVVS